MAQSKNEMECRPPEEAAEAPKALQKRPRPGRVYRVAGNLLLLTVGSAIYSVGVNGILVPQGFLNGGMVGVGLILNYFYPFLSLGLLYVLLNLPLFFLGWLKVSQKFIYYTGLGIILFSVLVEVIKVPPFAVSDPMLAAIFAGIICGIGAGIILRSSGSVGGLDILTVYLYQRFSIPMGWTSSLVNAAIIGVAAIFFGLEIALYTMVFIFVQAKFMDAVLTGFNQRKSLIIVSDKYEEVAAAIMEDLHRGVTYLEGAGAYSGRSKKVIFSVTTLTELARMKNLVFSIDPNAFVVVNDTLDVLGSTLGSRRTY